MEDAVGRSVARPGHARKQDVFRKSVADKQYTRHMPVLQKKGTFGQKMNARVHRKKIIYDSMDDDTAEEAEAAEAAEPADDAGISNEPEVDDRAVTDDGLGGGDGLVQSTRREPCDRDVASEDASLLKEFAAEF